MPAPRLPSPPSWPDRLATFRAREWDPGAPPAGVAMAEAGAIGGAIWRETEARRAWHAARQRFAARNGCAITAEKNLVWSQETRRQLEAELEQQRQTG